MTIQEKIEAHTASGKGYRMGLTSDIVRRNCDIVGQRAYDEAIAEGKSVDDAKSAYFDAKVKEYLYYINV